MATIPIEVIVQDADTPVDPTPTPETNNTETNITVPDTGAKTLGNNTFSSSSAASIILPIVLLVVSLATICTLLIHRHHKRQDSKVSKKEKLSMSASATIAVLAATVLVGDLILPVTKAATSDTEVSIEVPDKISIVVNREDDITEATTEATAYVTSTSAFGYKVLLSMAEGVATSNLYLNGDNTSEYYIVPVENETFSTNTWGYTLAGEETYNQVPLLDTPATIAQGEESVGNEELTIYYGVNIDKSLPEGKYTSELEYSVVTQEPTIDTLTYMQDFTALSEDAKASVFNSMVEDRQYYLKDNRDDKTYRIARLKDGNVWMTQNLDLQKEDLLEGVSIDNNNTDNPIANFVLPDSQTSGDESWGNTNDEAATNTTHIYDIDNSTTYYYCSEYQPWGVCKTYSTDPVPITEIGNYYNWYAATAGTGTYSLSENETALGSICPSGWRLPGNTIDNAADYGNLLSIYGISGGEMFKAFEAPILLVRAGEYLASSGLNGVGEKGNLQSSNARYNYGISIFSFRGNVVWFQSDGFKNSGYSIRCLVR